MLIIRLIFEKENVFPQTIFTIAVRSDVRRATAEIPKRTAYLAMRVVHKS